MPVTAEASRVGAQAQGATESSLKALDSTGVRLERVCVAREMTSKVGPRSFLHAGPPISLADIPGPMRGAIIGGLLFEGEARDVAEAEAIIDSGEIEISPCHDAGGLGASRASLDRGE